MKNDTEIGGLMLAPATVGLVKLRRALKRYRLMAMRWQGQR